MSQNLGAYHNIMGFHILHVKKGYNFRNSNENYVLAFILWMKENRCGSCVER